MEIETIKEKLGIMKKVPGRDFYEWRVGRFVLQIYTSPRSFWKDDDILLHETVRADVLEVRKTPNGNIFTNYISIRDDEPFKDYKPIQYNTVATPNGYVNLGDGNKMPVHHLCELIRYLYRLSNLTAFE